MYNHPHNKNETTVAHIINIASHYVLQDKLAANLRQLLLAKNISEAELARQTNVPQPTLHKILSGKTSDPRASTLKSLADFFNTTIDDLMTGENAKIHTKQSGNIQSIAVITWDDCHHYKKKLAKLTPENWNQWIVTEFISVNAFALKSKPSMEPKFPKGSILIIDPDITPEDGDLVIAHYGDTATTTIRELSIDGPIRILSTICKTQNSQSTNNENVKILGVVMKSIFNFD